MATTTYDADQALPRIDVRIFAGRPMGLRVNLADGDGDALPGAAVVSARAQVRREIDDPTVWHTFDSEADPVSVTISDGYVTLVATSDETSEWAELWPGTAPETFMWWDLEITDEDGEDWQMTAPGLFVLAHQVTR
jgi:hypothetical protein